VEESPDGAALRLVLDPLADYLAALGWLRQLDREGEGAWEVFLQQTLPARGSEGAALAQGFLRALYDGAVHAKDSAVLGLEVPPGVVAKLAERAAIDPARIARERERRRLRRLIDDLAEPDLAVRLQAIEELCRRRTREEIVTTALARVLMSEQQDHEVRQAAAIALAAQGGVSSARALAELLDSPKPDGADSAGTVALRRTALEGLGVCLASLGEASQAQVREELRQLLEGQLHADALDLLVEDEAGWAEHDRRLPLLQGASRGLQLAASSELPLLGSSIGRKVNMLTLKALQERNGIRITTTVVSCEVWSLPLPGGEQLELVIIPGGQYYIGSPESESGRDTRSPIQFKENGVANETLRRVTIDSFALSRYPITQSQWRVVASLPAVSRSLSLDPGKAIPEHEWERLVHGGGLCVDSVKWNDCEEWLNRLNIWLEDAWKLGKYKSKIPRLTFPSEHQWEIACRACESRAFHFGDTIDTCWARYNGSLRYGQARPGKTFKQPGRAGEFGLFNKWGLSDMHGQLFEWCKGTELSSLNQVRLKGNDQRPPFTLAHSPRMLRGGSWMGPAHFARAAFRSNDDLVLIGTFVGLRPCVNI
jgi:formylglycine-generating enzyme required for sulfatase activity